MAEKSFRREFAEELFCKAMVTAASTAAGIVLAAPVGVSLAVAATVLVACPTVLGGSAPNASQSKE